MKITRNGWVKCPNCQYEGHPKRYIKGNGFLEIALWFCFFIPGIIYSIWRSTSRYWGCPRCKYDKIYAIEMPETLPEGQPIYKEKFYKQPWFKVAAIGGIFLYMTVMISIAANSNPSTKPTDKLGQDGQGNVSYRFNPTTGSDALLSSREDGSCDGFVVLGTTRENQEKVTKASIAKDNAGLALLTLNGEAIMVANCTKVKVIDSTITLREVRVLEGEKAFMTGWTPFEWLKPVEEL